MAEGKRSELISREAILELLSNEEVARVSTDESSRQLEYGEEYVDLLRLNQGVQSVKELSGARVPNALPRRDVQDATWAKIVAQLKG